MVSALFSIIISQVVMAKIEYSPNLHEKEIFYMAIKSFNISITAYLIIALGLSILLIIGAHVRKATLIFPFLCLGFTSIVAFIAGFVGFIAFTMYIGEISITSTLVVLLGATLSLAFKVYWWLVIYHFYQELLCEMFGRKINPETGKIFREPFEHDV